MRGNLPILLFASQAAFGEWLAKQGDDAPGAWLRFAKKGASVTSLTKAEAIDAALCHGWIDGQLDKYDGASWLIRFTPRKPRSKWSEVNRKRAIELIVSGQMQRRGIAEVERAKADGRWEAAYAPASTAKVPEDLAAALGANPEAKSFFEGLTGANRYAVLYRIGAVKRPETRARKIAKFVAMLARRETLHG
ncbi:YdeI/OmpD-associated family protein [Novosphingobium kunmingense]|nr:YdeI/OmpD-associated family protein [Novosphingobium kunmingense]